MGLSVVLIRAFGKWRVMSHEVASVNVWHNIQTLFCLKVCLSFARPSFWTDLTSAYTWLPGAIKIKRSLAVKWLTLNSVSLLGVGAQTGLSHSKVDMHEQKCHTFYHGKPEKRDSLKGLIKQRNSLVSFCPLTPRKSSLAPSLNIHRTLWIHGTDYLCFSTNKPLLLFPIFYYLFLLCTPPTSSQTWLAYICKKQVGCHLVTPKF